MSTDNGKARIILLKEYKEFLTSDRGIIVCMMGEEVTNKNYWSVHHIRALREGGSNSIFNKALVSILAHQEFNLIEAYKYKRAKEINEALIEFKKNKNKDIPYQIKDYKDYLLRDLGITNNEKKMLRKRKR